MRHMVRALAALAVIATAAFAMPAHVLAMPEGFRHSSETSVFPQPRDPWRSWGVRNELPHHVGRPYVHDGFVHQPVQVWVPGQWAWNGATWVWWPGHWDVY